MIYKYGEFSQNQIYVTKESIKKSIFFLLLLADPKNEGKYPNVDVLKAFNNLLHKIGGMNSIFNEPPELVSVISLLEAALIEWTSSEFRWQEYRKLILDALNEVEKIKEVD